MINNPIIVYLKSKPPDCSLANILPNHHTITGNLGIVTTINWNSCLWNAYIIKCPNQSLKELLKSLFYSVLDNSGIWVKQIQTLTLYLIGPNLFGHVFLTHFKKSNIPPSTIWYWQRKTTHLRFHKE